MSWPNLNWPSVLWKKLDRVKDCVIVWNSLIFGRLPMGRGDGWEEGCEIVLIDRNPAYVVAEFELAKCCVEKVGQGQRLCNCVNMNFWRATHRQGEDGEGGLPNFFDKSQPYLGFGQA